MLKNVGNRFRSDRNDKLSKSAIVEHGRNDLLRQELTAAKQSLSAHAKDSNDLVQFNKADEGDLGSTPEFANNNFWRQPPTSEEDLDEMLRAEGMLD